jgi:hypothetical protein
MPSLIFAGSILFAIWIAIKKQIPPISTYGIFLAFTLLYNVTPFLANRLDLSVAPLLADNDVISTQLLLAASAIVCFGLVFLFGFSRVKFTARQKTIAVARRRNYVVLALPLFLVTCILCAKYGWHAYSAAVDFEDESLGGGLFTLTAYVKYCFVAVYIYYLYRFDFDKWASILLGENVVVMAIDGGRTTVFPIILLTIMIVYDKSTERKTRRKIYMGLVLAVCVSILVRSVIVQGDSLLLKLVIPIGVEGMMGAYPSLQSIYAVRSIPHPAFTYGISYLLDPIMWLLPQADLREKFSFLQGWSRHILPVLPDRQFAPMGGFYYLAESIAAFSYLGPALVTTCFALALVSIERMKNKHRLFYFVWTSTIGILFVKTIFGNVFKLFVIQSIAVMICLAGTKLWTGVRVTCSTNSQAFPVDSLGLRVDRPDVP